MAPLTLLPTVCTSGTRTWWFWFSAASTYARTYSKESRIPVETLEFFLFFQMPLILLCQVTLKAIFKCSKYIFMSSFVCVIWWCMCFYMCRCRGQRSWDGCQAFSSTVHYFNFCRVSFWTWSASPWEPRPHPPRTWLLSVVNLNTRPRFCGQTPSFLTEHVPALVLMNVTRLVLEWFL